jgi:hypothetical protein
MCPIRVHWHVKQNYREYWRVKASITNYDMVSNYSDWNLVVRHPNLANITQLFSFNYQPLIQYDTISKCHSLDKLSMATYIICHKVNLAGLRSKNGKEFI